MSKTQTWEGDGNTTLAVGPVQTWDKGEVVIRNAAELVAHSATSDQAKDAESQRKMTQELARILQVDDIDWDTQMVIGIYKKEFGAAGSKRSRYSPV